MSRHLADLSANAGSLTVMPSVLVKLVTSGRLLRAGPNVQLAQTACRIELASIKNVAILVPALAD